MEHNCCNTLAVLKLKHYKSIIYLSLGTDPSTFAYRHRRRRVWTVRFVEIATCLLFTG